MDCLRKYRSDIKWQRKKDEEHHTIIKSKAEKHAGKRIRKKVLQRGRLVIAASIKSRAVIVSVDHEDANAGDGDIVRTVKSRVV